MARSIDPAELFQQLAGRPPAGDELEQISRAAARWRGLVGSEIDQETLAFAVLIAALARSRADQAGEAAARRVESASEALAARAESAIGLLEKKIGEVAKAGVREIGDEVVRSRRRPRTIKIHGLIGIVAGVAGGVLTAVYLPWELAFAAWVGHASPPAFAAGALVAIAIIALLQAVLD